MQILWDDGERTFSRERRCQGGSDRTVLLARAAAEQPHPACLGRIVHEFGLKDELDESWALRPLELVREAGQMHLVLEDVGGEPLVQLLAAPMQTSPFLQHAISIAVALGKLHQRGLVHKDIKPS
ncbi:MAG: hypothetical protein C0411_24035, partial [Pseudomonas sp.]|nr:hypothetical protein [Pseudomonas sp.]